MSDDATAFTAAGYSPDLAEAFEGRRLTVERVKRMSRAELLDEYLRWEGIIGYTYSILTALQAIDRVKEQKKC